MKNFLLKTLIRFVPYLLWRAPKFSVSLLGLISKNPNVKKLKSRPEMIARAGKSIATGGILIAQLNVTNACNQKCPMCNLWEEGTQMPLERVKLAIDRIAELGSFMLTITGGEPFSHPDIAEIINYAHAKQFWINVNTNASIPLRHYQAVDLSKIDVAIVSMHAINENKLEKITGVKNTLPKVQQALHYFKENSAMRIILKYVIQSGNDGEMEKVQEFADREGFTVEYHPVMVGSTNRPVATNKQELNLSQEKLLTTLLTIQERKTHDKIFESSVYYQFCIDAINRGSLSWKCDAGLNYLSIYPDGSFGICKDIYTSAKITDPDFIEKYHSQKFNEEMKNLREGCEGCNWSCYITASKMAHMIKNPNVADLAMLKSY
ncbi:MAG: radical SAM protein [uncultured bacterium]|nr:MAG: radical SAM protein [uncultured bacterium]